jgi:HSP20 family protein
MVFRDLSIRNPLYQFRDEMDRLFNGFFGPAAEGAVSTFLRGQPAVNLWEQDDAVVVEMEVPGVKKDQIDLSVVGRELTIRINRPEVVQENVVCHRCERPVGNFSRTLPLPSDVDADHVAANLQEGVLTITLPKAEIAKPRKITVA